ncbi:hypothetical protein GCM10023170_058880 [Phytohabitans houttuyneae]|uniref:Uncharacterized protein n=1 Tax=Phytohabitans houttuyneae TaxID=1076126 RepID=A0A6V8KFI6_9ACTN|nr:hypothetical protein Phou_054210 [Phytohabitans houttuyneae]
MQLTTAGGLFGLVIDEPKRFALLALIPITSYLLCGRFVTQVHAVEALARYIREVLNRKVGGGFNWERWQRDTKRKDYAWAWFIPLLLTFPGASVLAIGGCAAVAVLDRKKYGVEGWALAALIEALVLGLVATVGSYLLLRGARKKLPDRPAG